MMGMDNKDEIRFNRRRLTVLSIILMLSIVQANLFSRNTGTLAYGDPPGDISRTRTCVMGTNSVTAPGDV